jgi:hypothetical protein
MPWFWILVLVIGVYLVVKLVQGIRELISWWIDERAFAELQQKSREYRRQGHVSKPPVLKERPWSSKPKRGP